MKIAIKEEKERRELDFANNIPPGANTSASKKCSEKRLTPQEHTIYRSDAGLLQYICEKRGDIIFAIKEVLRKLASSTEADDTAFIRIARYLKCVPNCILDFP